MVSPDGSIGFLQCLLLSAAQATGFHAPARLTREVIDKRTNAVLQITEGGPKNRALHFILDSGANVHACNDASLFTKFYKNKRRTPVTVANGASCKIEAVGDIQIKLPTGKDGTMEDVIIRNVNYMPSLDVNILSVRQLWKGNGIKVKFRDNATVTFPSGARFVLPSQDGNYIARVGKVDLPNSTTNS